MSFNIDVKVSILLMIKLPWLDYSLSAPVIVIVMVAVAEELLLTLLVTSLLGMLVSAIEIAVSLSPNRTNPTRRIARVTTVTSLFTSTPS